MLWKMDNDNCSEHAQVPDLFFIQYGSMWSLALSIAGHSSWRLLIFISM